MEDQTVHMILGWRCKTKDCGMFHFAKYLGEKEKVMSGTRIPLTPKGDLVVIPCPQCHQRHAYDPKEVRYMEVAGPRPEGLRDLL
ncbi:MAG TPA: hypothetical protein VE377_22145 [Candidatus Dormibacteraeota bacterium]|nr:hypothetical protein [Candidatus Dormibacteraeota bacterium]